jgi:hypothetical protein
MSTQEPGRSQGAPTLTALPNVEDLATAPEGYDPEQVREAFVAFRRHATQLQAQLRVMQAAGRTPAAIEATGHSVRMDSLHLIRAAAEFADTLERDAQQASAAQLARTEEEVSRRQRELRDREAEIERYRQESERQRAEVLNAAKTESRELLANAHRDATQEVQEAEARGTRLLEQSRHQATELTNAARAEVEQTLEWARAQAAAILARAGQGAEQLLRVAGLGEPALSKVAEALIQSASDTNARGAAASPRPVESLPAVAAAVMAPLPEDERPAEPESRPEAPAAAPPPVAPPPPTTEAPPPPPPVSAPPPVRDAGGEGESDGPQT